LVDTGATALALAGVSIPNFWLGPLLAIVFAIQFGWFPVSGRGTMAHLVLPAVSLGGALAAILTRMTRATLLEERGHGDGAAARNVTALRVDPALRGSGATQHGSAIRDAEYAGKALSVTCQAWRPVVALHALRIVPDVERAVRSLLLLPRLRSRHFVDPGIGPSAPAPTGVLPCNRSVRYSAVSACR